MKTNEIPQKTLKTLLTLIIILGFYSVAAIYSQDSNEKEATFEEKRDYFFKKMENRLRSKRKLKNGWQVVYTTQKGSVLYGYVKNDKITHHYVGSKNIKGKLPNPNSTSSTSKETQQGETSPSSSDCRRRAWNCITGSLCKSFWGMLKLGSKLITLDLEGIEQQLDDESDCIDKCIGETCKRILQI